MVRTKEHAPDWGGIPKMEIFLRREGTIKRRILIGIEGSVNIPTLCLGSVLLNSLTQGAEGSKDCGVIRIIGP
jgi:hypothetical protein